MEMSFLITHFRGSSEREHGQVTTKSNTPNQNSQPHTQTEDYHDLVYSTMASTEPARAATAPVPRRPTHRRYLPRTWRRAQECEEIMEQFGGPASVQLESRERENRRRRGEDGRRPDRGCDGLCRSASPTGSSLSPLLRGGRWRGGKGRQVGMPGKVGHVEHEVEKRHSGGVPNRLFVLVVEADNFTSTSPHIFHFYL
jgi:hypothetical protein